jgi:hypothetical protein
MAPLYAGGVPGVVAARAVAVEVRIEGGALGEGLGVGDDHSEGVYHLELAQELLDGNKYS